jgi:hypothetical protein
MCDVDYDEAVKVWDELTRKARMRHQCTGCREIIEPGHVYRRTATLFDGRWTTYKHCLRCSVIVDALRLKPDHEFGETTLLLACGEVWENPPPHIEALAFALPGEAVQP